MIVTKMATAQTRSDLIIARAIKATPETDLIVQVILRAGSNYFSENKKMSRSGDFQQSVTNVYFRWLRLITMSLVILDIDECKEDIDACHSDARCKNTKGSYNCTCNIGYEGNGHDCTGKDF